MTTPPHPHDAILEITMRPGGFVGDEMRLSQVRVPLFGDPQSRDGHGALIEVGGELPWRLGQTRRARAWFLAPSLALAQFPAGARFWSFGMEGRVVEWTNVPAAILAE